MAFIRFKPLGSKENFYHVIEKEQMAPELENILSDKEEVIIGFKTFRDMGIFTDKRIILINKKGLRGFCKSVLSVQYKSISSYCLNVHELDSTIELILDSGYQLILNFYKPIPLEDMYKVYKYISDYVINKSK